MLFLKEDVGVSIRCGPFVSPTDGYTAVTNAAPTVYLSKNHGAFAARGGTTWTHDRDGWYTCQLSTTDTNTPGALVLEVVGAATYLPVFQEFYVLGANVYDSLFPDTTAAGDLLQVDTQQVTGTAQTARDLGASVLLSAGTGAGQISLTAGAVTVGTNNDKTGYTASTVSDKTGYSLATSQAFNTSGSVGSVTGAVGSVTAGVTLATGAVTAAAIATGAIDADALATDAVEEIADGVLDRSLTEPTGVFTWPATLRTIIKWIGALARNKTTQSSSTQTLRNDADNADLATSAISDVGGTTTRGEWT